MANIISILIKPQLQSLLIWTCLSFGVLLLCYWLITQYIAQQKLASIASQFKSMTQQRSQRQLQIDSLLCPLTQLVNASDQQMQQRFIGAGIYQTRYSSMYMPLKYLVLAIGEVVVIGVCWWSGVAINQAVALICGWAMVSIALPDMVLAQRTKWRHQKLVGQLPYLIDLTAICVQSGMTIEASLKYLAQEMQGFDRDLAYLLNKTNHRARVVGMEEALEELYQQVPSSEMRSFVMTLTQSIQHGSSIYRMLTVLASDVREVQMLELEEKIGKLAAKMSIPLIVFILIPIVFVIAAPGVMRLMQSV
ncbi:MULTISPECIES: type II secretion system F family protein [Vibrio]|uniref:Type II secretion system F family protein n=2 Tax=Vibrio TaxID=662 RepID=A0A5M9N9X4_9VIBR|nr:MULTISPECIES: type II secretion system F family protein [Vibrio]KAA8666513.1 type II secretion system F family protein [Vibrio gigantis]MDH5951359.1 type II secretion system F family protein [Vibrio crassostreae]ROO49379.1 tight adherence protein C [Vibrio crassostreae]ROO49813.1 tight adherence protein C [Vibrio crassostreae]ROO65066.1 tight adherence protein C [Vibrio crassostreae]